MSTSDDTAGARCPSVPARVVAGLISLYRSAISPLLGPSCRYAPSCSEYALIAVQRFGALRGSWLALRRLARCGPWHRGGYDPVPERFRSSRPDRPTALELEPQP